VPALSLLALMVQLPVPLLRLMVQMTVLPALMVTLPVA
jgi:hypothetical protein